MTTYNIQTPIIPIQQTFYNNTTMQLEEFTFKNNYNLDLESIAVFCAIGFFLDDSSFFKQLKVLKPATNYTIQNKKIIDIKKSWEWSYSPRNISLSEVTNEFQTLFERNIHQSIKNKKVILPLSGGLDSRSLATALRNQKNIFTYSYEFENGINENYYASKIAKKSHFPYKQYTIKKSYLWNSIETLSNLNQCFSEFTHPRQMAIYDKFNEMGDIFLLGHWGDVLFDNSHFKEDLSHDETVQYIFNLIIKKGGIELAELLWKEWGLKGAFKEYLLNQISHLLNEIKIQNSNAKIRAFKSIHWAPRWTSVNLAIFHKIKPIALPYYSDEMCKFITTIPEDLLANRKIQIEYIKKYSPDIAKIAWQTYAPCNLYNYQEFKSIKNIPFRIQRKVKRIFNETVLNKSTIQRNWEIQFVGAQNEQQLLQTFSNQDFINFVGKNTIDTIYNAFKDRDPIYYSHPLSMLLTLSQFTYKAQRYS